jgi:hypothetical protein
VELTDQPKKSKYNSKKAEVDGIIFDSKGEARKYAELKLLEQSGKISNLQLQVIFELQPKFKKNGKTIRAINYVADFVYHQDNQVVVLDFKGMILPQFILKKKLFEYKFPDLELIVTK